MRSSSSLGTSFTAIALIALPAFAGGASAPVCESATAGVKPALQEWNQTVQAMPLFTALSTRPPKACEFEVTDGTFRVVYRFVNGNRLEAERNEAIEYVSISARIEKPLRRKPTAVLAASERALFGESGCGIDWDRPRMEPSSSGSTGRRSVFSGTSCNCKATIERAVDGATTALSLSAAC